MPIEQRTHSLEVMVVENPGRVCEFVKGLVESSCRAVLGERPSSFDEASVMLPLFTTAPNHLPVLSALAIGAFATFNNLYAKLVREQYL